MVKKAATSKQTPQDQSRLQEAVKDSAHQIWLAGLGAFQKAQEEGNKMFDVLVEEGLAMQRKAQTATGEKLTQASQKMTRMAEELGDRASDQWDRFEHLFELRVARALHRLGMPSTREVQALNERVAELEGQRPARARKTAAKKTSSPTRKSAAKKASSPARKAARKKAG